MYNKFSRRRFLQQTSAIGLVASASGIISPQLSFAAAPKKGGHFAIGVQLGEITSTLDPALSPGDATFYALAAFGNKLTDIDADGRLVPSLAESWESSEAGKKWHFKLRKGVEFHNGKTMTADDVVKTLLRHADKETRSAAFGIMKDIDVIKADGDGITLNLKVANLDLPFLLTDYHLIIQPNGGLDIPFSGVGTGPYKLTDHAPGIRYAFEKFENHWDSSVGHYDSHEILVIKDDQARIAALQSGDIHAIDAVPARIAKHLSHTPDIDLIVASGKGHYVFLMHVDTPPFDNKDLRLAIKHALNRTEIIDKVFAGYGSIGNDIPINDSYPLFNEKLAQRGFSLEKASELYKKSGHDGSPIELCVSDTAFSGAIDAAQIFEKDANAAGIPLVVKPVPIDGYWTEVWNKKPFCASYWGGRPVQDQMWSTGYLSEAEWNDTRFKNPLFDELLLKARGELDEAKRKQIYAQMSEIVWQEGGTINMLFFQRIDAYSEKIAGKRPHKNNSLLNGYVASRTWFA